MVFFVVISFWFNSSSLFQAEWGPLRHIRVIKERNSGVSRGFAFIDFPDVVPFIEFIFMCHLLFNVFAPKADASYAGCCSEDDGRHWRQWSCN